MNEPLWLTIARGELGTREIEGPKSNSRIVEYAKIAAGIAAPDNDAWCATFVGWSLAQADIHGTDKRNARSYLEFGVEVPAEDVQLGDIVVFWRVSPSSWQGHVAFFLRSVGDKVEVLGGNQGNKVSIARYPRSQILDIRRPENAPVIKPVEGDQVLKRVQSRLKELGYHEVGVADGKIGTKTRGALLAFKADWNERTAGTKNDLPVDASYGDEVLAALMTAHPRSVSVERETATDAAIADYAAVKEAKKTGVLGKVTVAIGGLGAAAESGLLDEAEKLVGLGGRIKGIVTEVWPLIGPLWPVAIIAGGVAIIIWVRKIRREEIESYRMGETP